MDLKIPIYKRSRRYGYIYWTYVLDDQVKAFFGGANSVDVIFENVELGKKKIDWKYRRVSVGWSRTRSLPTQVSTYHLTFAKDGKLKVRCK